LWIEAEIHQERVIMEERTEVFEGMELKYCERCGGLWLRRRGSGRAFCSTCEPKMEGLPEGGRKTGPSSRLAKVFDLEGSVRELVEIGEGDRP
jgi:hypothetical protein